MTILAHPAIRRPDFSFRDDDVLVREANHRIANQLMLLASMVQLESATVAKGPEFLPRDAAKAVLDKLKSNILAMGKLHRQLATGPAGKVKLADHLMEGTASLFAALAIEPRPGVKHRLHGDCVVTGEQAQLISLIVSEIIINAIKHAHPSGIPVQIQIACNRTMDGRILVEIGDDGVGLPEGFDSKAQAGQGFTLIRLLAERLNADLRIESDSLGLSFLFLIPTAH